jgi:hypothetical protein
MLILAAALLAAQTPDYRYHIAARPGSTVATLQSLCKRFEAAKSERNRQKLVPSIKARFRVYTGDRDELMLRCARRVAVR